MRCKKTTLIFMFIFIVVLTFMFKLTVRPKKHYKKRHFFRFCKPTSVTPNYEYKFGYFKCAKAYIYSAFMDYRVDRTIKVFVIAAIEARLYCNLYYKDGVSIMTHSSQQRLGMNKFDFRTFVHVCYEPLGKDPIAVSLSCKPCYNSPSTIRKVNIRGKIPESNVPNTLLLCMKTLYNFDSPKRLIEYIEYQRIAGVNHVRIYGFHNPSEAVMKVVNYYQRQGFLSVQQWNVPVTTSAQPEGGGQVKTYAQKLYIHDCLYRNMDNYKYMLMSDIDEFIIPHQNSFRTYQSIIQEVKKDAPPTAAYMFANAWFCLSNEGYRNESYLLLQSTDKRSQARYSATKFILESRRLEFANIHTVSEAITGYTNSATVQTSLAIMHHYRGNKWTSDNDCPITDKTAYSLGNNLQQKVEEISNSLVIQ